jgi:hypothetical protein
MSIALLDHSFSAYLSSSAATLAKVYSNALMTSLNSRSRGRSADAENAGAASQQYSGSSFSNPGRHIDRSSVNPLASFNAGPVTTGGAPTVVHITTSTDREVDYTFEEEDIKTQDVCSYFIITG